MVWYDNNYLFNRAININILDPIPIDTPITVDLNTAVMFGSNKVMDDLSDIVAVYLDTTTATPTFIALPTLCSLIGNDITFANNGVLDTLPETLQVQFSTYEPINITNNQNYFIYYGNQNAIAPEQPNFNWWPSSVNFNSNRVTYRHPGEEWIDGVSTKINAKASFTFSGTAIEVAAEVSPNGGIASVQIDNNAPITADCYASSSDTNIIYTEINLEPNYHTIRIVNTGQHDPSSIGTTISLLAFQYLGYAVAIDLGENINPTFNWSTNTGGTS